MSNYAPNPPAPPRSRNDTARRLSRKALRKTFTYALILASCSAVIALGSLLNGNLLAALALVVLIVGVLMIVALFTHGIVIGTIEEELGRNRDAAADSVGNPHINIDPCLYNERLQAQCYVPTFKVLPLVNLIIMPIGVLICLGIFNFFGVFFIPLCAFSLTKIFNIKPKMNKLSEEDARRSNKAWRNAKRYLDDDPDDPDDPDYPDNDGETIR